MTRKVILSCVLTFALASITMPQAGDPAAQQPAGAASTELGGLSRFRRASVPLKPGNERTLLTEFPEPQLRTDAIFDATG